MWLGQRNQLQNRELNNLDFHKSLFYCTFQIRTHFGRYNIKVRYVIQNFFRFNWYNLFQCTYICIYACRFIQIHICWFSFVETKLSVAIIFTRHIQKRILFQAANDVWDTNDQFLFHSFCWCFQCWRTIIAVVVCISFLSQENTSLHKSEEDK